MKGFFAKTALVFLIGCFIAYFSTAGVLRYQKLYSNYFDLGIMHQTAYNTYRAVATEDYGRFLELTNPHGSQQFNRMAVHVDVTIALVAMLYFIYSSPATLVVAQAAIVGIGAWYVYLIARHIFHGYKMQYALSLTFAGLYLMQPALQRIVLFDFHAVALAMTSILMMIYYMLKKRYVSGFVAFVFSVLSKEQVALTTGTLAGLIVFEGQWKSMYGHVREGHMKALWSSAQRRALSSRARFPLIILLSSIVWFFIVIFLVIPYYRQGDHFAVERYNSFGNSSGGILLGLLLNPQEVFKSIFSLSTFSYVVALLSPYAFLSLLSPMALAALPEAAINLLSNSTSMRSINFHYTALFHPIMTYSAILGARRVLDFFSDAKIPFHDVHHRHHHNRFTKLAHVKRAQKSYVLSHRAMRFFGLFIFIGVGIIVNIWRGPLPFAVSPSIAMFGSAAGPQGKIYEWADRLRDENVTVSTTSSMAPYFTSRRFFYNFSAQYVRAEYVIIRPSTVTNNPFTSYDPTPQYEKLKKDDQYKLVDSGEDFEVYQRM